MRAHYLIGRDGAIIQLVDERARAWHAGESKWGGATDLNSASLGIELDSNDAAAAIRAFNLHFLPQERSSALTERGLGLLYCPYGEAGS